MNIKNLLGIGLFFAVLLPTYAQLSIEGKVEETGTRLPLPGAFVTLKNLKKETVTNFDGEYRFEGLRPGNYLLEVKLLGYKAVSKKVSLIQNTILDFELPPSATELSEVVITGVTRATERKRSPVVIAAIDQSYLRQNAATNLIDGLKDIPGVSQITTGASVSKPVIRGLGFNRVLTLNNGIRQEGQQWGDEHGIEIDQFSVDRVEIVKGPGSLVYGSDGIAGVLNFLPPKPVSDGKVETNLITNYQSNNDLLGYSVTNAGNQKGIQWLGQFSHKMARDYQNAKDGKVFNSGFKELNGKLFLGIDKNWGYSHVTVSTFNTNLGIVEGERDPLGRFTYENAAGEEVTAIGPDYKGYQIYVPHQKINHLSLASNNYFMLKKGVIKADLGFQNNRRREFEEPDEPDDPGLYLNLNTFSYNVHYDFEEIKGWESSVGASGMVQKNKNKGEEFLIPDYNLFDVGLFVFTQKNVGKWTVAAGFRADRRSLRTNALYLDEEENPVSPTDPSAGEKFTALRRNFTGFSGSLGFTYQLNEGSTFKLNLSRGFRAPNIAELASNGVHEGTFRYEVGNGTLKSENSHQIDLGYYLDNEHLNLEITPFINLIDHYVYIQKSEEMVPGDGVDLYDYTAGNAKVYGGEIYLDIHPHPLDWLHFENSLSVVRGVQSHQEAGEKYLPSMPAAKYQTELRGTLEKVGRNLSKGYVKFGLAHSFKQDKIHYAYDTETATPSYTLLNFGAGVTMAGLGRSDFMNLVITVENLTDKVYQDHLSRLKYAPVNPLTGERGVFNRGRNFSIKLSFAI